MCVKVGGTYFCINLIIPHKFIFGHSCNMLSLLYCVLAECIIAFCYSILNSFRVLEIDLAGRKGVTSYIWHSMDVCAE